MAQIFHKHGFVTFDLGLRVPRIRELPQMLQDMPEDVWRAVIRNRHGEFDLARTRRRTIRRQHLTASQDLATGVFSFSFLWINDSAQPPVRFAKELLESIEMTHLLARITHRRPHSVSQLYLSRYDPGAFLSTHRDPGQSYGVAINLTEQWDPTYGGLTVVLNEDQSVRACLCPRPFHALVFDTSHRSIPHFVSRVAPFVRSPRLALIARFHDASTAPDAAV